MQSRAQHLRALISFSNPKWEFLQYTRLYMSFCFFPNPCNWRYIKANSSDTQLVVPILTCIIFLLTAYHPLNTGARRFLFCNYCSTGTRSSWTSLRFSTRCLTWKLCNWVTYVITNVLRLSVCSATTWHCTSQEGSKWSFEAGCIVWLTCGSVSSLGRTVKALMLANGQERDRLTKHVQWNVSAASQFLPVYWVRSASLCF